MKMDNPFPEEVRNLWLDWWSCADCGTNGGGMLELHHIVGRRSNSALNGVVVCTECHSHYGHSKEEEKRLFAKNLAILKAKKYQLTEKDEQFMEDHPYLLLNNEYLAHYGL